MKKITASFAAGILAGALLFSGAAAYAAGVMAERSSNRVFVDGREVQIEAYANCKAYTIAEGSGL